MNEDSIWIMSRKISIKSMTRHFAAWKLRLFVLDRSNALLANVRHHYYSNDKKFCLSLKYVDSADPTSEKEMIMKFESLEKMNKWNKSLTDTLNENKKVFTDKSKSYFNTFGEYIREQSHLQRILERDHPHPIGTADTRLVHVDVPNNNISNSSIGGNSNNVDSSSSTNYHSNAMIRSNADCDFWQIPVPKLRILIMAVGTRGDMQPFVQLGLRLQSDGHRVRIATHASFRSYIIEKGLEFYPLAGDPVKLSEFMVKTHGFIIPTTTEQILEVPKHHSMIVDIMYSCWNACIDPDPEDVTSRPFVADAIISNPVTYGHIHCAEALGVPLHLMFPQPWIPTKAFPHPLSCLSYQQGWCSENFISYQVIDRMLWLSFESNINAFRKNILGLQPIRVGEGGWNMLNLNRVPFVKMWSPTLVPKPKDWPDYVDVVGTFFDSTEIKGKKNNLKSMTPKTPATAEYQPSVELSRFLDSDVPVVFIGFGSMVIQNIEQLVSLFLESAALAGVRVLIQMGWSSISAERFMELAREAENKTKLVRQTEYMNRSLVDSVIFPSGEKIDLKSVLAAGSDEAVSKGDKRSKEMSSEEFKLKLGISTDDVEDDVIAKIGEKHGRSHSKSHTKQGNNSEERRHSVTGSKFGTHSHSGGHKSGTRRHSSSSVNNSQDSKGESKLPSKTPSSTVPSNAPAQQPSAPSNMLTGWFYSALTTFVATKKPEAAADNAIQHPEAATKPSQSTVPQPVQRDTSSDSMLNDWGNSNNSVDIKWSARTDAFFLGPVPHTWLFKHVDAVVHHGGAGTTAAGLRYGCPTWICPFFGDQFFWGELVHRGGLGPRPCPVDTLTLDIVAESLAALRSDKLRQTAQDISKILECEDGVEGAVDAFYRHLPIENMICDVSMLNGESRLAQIFCKDCGFKMCAEVSDVIHAPTGDCSHHQLVPCRYMNWTTPKPLSAAAGIVQGIGGLVHELAEGMSDVIYDPVRGIYTEGLQGAATGLVTGVQSLLTKPLTGGGLLVNRVAAGIRNSLGYQDADSPIQSAKDGESIAGMVYGVDHSSAQNKHIRSLRMSSESATDSATRLRDLLYDPDMIVESTVTSPIDLCNASEDAVLVSSKLESGIASEGDSDSNHRHTTNTVPSHLLSLHRQTTGSRDSLVLHSISEDVLHIRSAMENEIHRVLSDSFPASPVTERGLGSNTPDGPERRPFFYNSEDDDQQEDEQDRDDCSRGSEGERDTDMEMWNESHSAFLLQPPLDDDVGNETVDLSTDHPNSSEVEIKTADTSAAEDILHEYLQNRGGSFSRPPVGKSIQYNDTSTTGCEQDTDLAIANPTDSTTDVTSPKSQLLQRSHLIESAYSKAVSAQQMFQLLGAKNARFMSLDTFTQLMYRALVRKHATTAEETSRGTDDSDGWNAGGSMDGVLSVDVITALVKLLARNKRYLDLVDFVLIYQEIIQGGLAWKNLPESVICCK